MKTEDLNRALAESFEPRDTLPRQFNIYDPPQTSPKCWKNREVRILDDIVYPYWQPRDFTEPELTDMLWRWLLKELGPLKAYNAVLLCNPEERYLIHLRWNSDVAEAVAKQLGVWEKEPL